jgi:hypothetical protein
MELARVPRDNLRIFEEDAWNDKDHFATGLKLSRHRSRIVMNI